MKKMGLLFYITLFLLILGFSTAASHFDFDLWARLIAGMGVIDGGHVLTSDFLSYTPVHTWYDHEWGSGVIFYSLLKYFGPYSLIVLQSILFYLILFISSKVVKLRYDNPYNILFYFFAIMTVIANLNQPVRCHMFSFVLFTLFIYMLEKVRRGNNKLLYLFPFIIIFWNNVHGGVVSGLGLLFMYALGEFLNGKPFKKYLITLCACLPVMLINPWGFEYIKFLIMANTMHRADIIEWWSIFAKYNMLKYFRFKIFMIFCLIVETITLKNTYKNADKVKYIVLGTTLYLAISHVKLMPFFVIASICFIYEDFYTLIKDVKISPIKDKLIYGLFLSISILTFWAKDFSAPISFEKYPTKEVEFIKINNIKGKILTNFGFGSYVAYKLYPHNQIFMDGRYEEVYYDFMVPLLKEFFLTRPQWELIFTNYTPDVMIIENMYPVYEKLKTSTEWKLIYEGKVFGVFVPKNYDTSSLKQPSNDIKYYKNTLFDTDIKF